jgi:hypothetical protein
MGYRLLGMIVWKGGRLLLQRKYGLWVPKPLLAGGLLAVLVGIALAAARSRGGEA